MGWAMMQRFLLLILALLWALPLAAQNATAPGDTCAGGNIAAGGQQAVNNAIYQCTSTGATQKWYPQPLYLGGTAVACDAAHAGLMRYGNSVGNTGSISYVQKTASIEAPLSGNSSTSFATLPTGGNTIIVVIGGFLNGGLQNLTDNQGNSYTLVLQNTDVYIYAAYNIGTPSGTFTITVAPGGTGNYFNWGAMEYTGINGVDQIGTATSSSTSNTVTTTGATNNVNELIVAAIKLDGSGQSWTTNITHDGSYTEQFLRNYMDANNVAYSVVTKMQAASATPSHQWTYTANPGGSYTTYAAMATFKSGHTPEICDGSAWRTLFQGGSGVNAPAGSGYFVLSHSTWNGNLGGLVGADAKCLTELTSTYTNWRGYSTANSNGQLVASKVRAFLCDQSFCNNLLPLTSYYFAYANDGTAGGAFMTSDSNGIGPNDYNAWAAANYFSGSYDYWVNMAETNAKAWTGTPSGNIYGTYHHCSSWTDGTSGGTGDIGNSAQTDGRRWGTESLACDGAKRLICLVNP